MRKPKPVTAGSISVYLGEHVSLRVLDKASGGQEGQEMHPKIAIDHAGKVGDGVIRQKSIGACARGVGKVVPQISTSTYTAPQT